MKLKDLLDLNDIIYSDGVSPKHQKKMDMPTELISSDMKVPITPFPENSSKETRNELEWLSTYNNGILDETYVKEGDSISKVFKKYCEENNLKYNKEYYEKIIEESSKTILSLKYYYNRPRPKQLADYYGIEEFKDIELSSMKTPSYPSGHSTQGHLVAELLGREYPGHYGNLKKLADFISKSRLMARAHYPSDCIFGEEVAQHILGKVIQKINEEKLTEVEWKIVIRKGKKIRKAICQPGYKFNPKKKKCVFIPGSEKMKQARSAKKGAKKRAVKMSKILKKRAKSMKKRKNFKVKK